MPTTRWEHSEYGREGAGPHVVMTGRYPMHIYGCVFMRAGMCVCVCVYVGMCVYVCMCVNSNYGIFCL